MSSVQVEEPLAAKRKLPAQWFKLEDVEDGDSDEEQGTTQCDKASEQKLPWITAEDVEEEEDEFAGMSWNERRLRIGALQSEESAKEDQVRFAANAAQWHARQRRRGDYDTRMSKVCGQGYDGEGPVFAQGQRVRKVNGVWTYSDSGASINVLSYATAQHLHDNVGIEFHKCSGSEPTQHIVFGKKSAKTKILGYMYGQGLVGKVAVVADVAANLISVNSFTQRDMLVTYTRDRVEIRKACDGEVVFIGPYDEKTGLYHMDIVHLMLAPDPFKRQGQDQAQSAPAAVGFAGVAVILTGEDEDDNNCEQAAAAVDAETGKQIKFKQAALLRGIRFHENMEHVPFTTCADNVEAGTWGGLHPDLTPALFRELGRRHDCVICGTTRWNQTHSDGSGRAYRIGHTVAFDYQGKVSPTSRNGETGEFIFTDLGSGFTKRYGERGDKTSVEDALKQWCAYMLSHGHVVREARHDSGSVEVGKQFETAARKLGVNPIATAPGDPEKRVERRVQTHKNDIAAIIARARLLKANDWDIASTQACLIQSTLRCEASKAQGDGTKSPYELITGKAPNIEVFQRYGLGDIGVVKKAAANRAGYGQAKNETVQITGMEVGEVMAVRVMRLEGGSNARRSKVEKLHLRATEPPSVEEQVDRQVTVVDGPNESVTFTVAGGREVVVESVQQLAAQEMELAREAADAEFESVAQRMQARREQLAKEAESEKTDDDKEAADYRNGWYWDWNEDDESPNQAYWVGFMAVHGMPSEGYARAVQDFTARTGVQFEMDFDDGLESDEADGAGEAMDDSGEGANVVGAAFAAGKSRPVRDASNPSRGMLNKDFVLAEMWQPSMVKERDGINLTSHVVTREYALLFGVTPHITVRTTKRDGTLKTRFAIDGRHEIRRGKFADKHALYSPAMDGELLHVSLQYAATLNMDIGKSDVVQCFTHNPMDTARFKRKLIVFMDEYESGVPGGQYREFDSVSYGTADASSEWYINMSREMVDVMGFRRSVHHPCLFFKGSVVTEDLITVSVATDDMLRLNLKTEAARKAMEDFNVALGNKWPVKHEDGDEFKEILGVAIERGLNGEIRCTQPSEMAKIRAAFFGEGDVPEVMVPLHPEIEAAGNECGGSFDDDDDSDEAREARSTPYRSLLGKLGYIRITRIDVLHALSVLAERAHRPARRDVHGLYWLAAYLLTTEHVPLVFHKIEDYNDAMNECGVFKWTLFADCSWATRANAVSCIAHMVVHGDLRTSEQRRLKPFTAPVVAKTGKQKGPAALSASAGELHGTVAAIRAGMPIRGMSEELAGVAQPAPSIERMPAGGAGASAVCRGSPMPTCTDNASNAMTLKSETGKKANGMRLMAREIAHVQYHVKEGSLEVVAVPGKEQRANSLTKPIRSASVHFTEAEWLLGTSPELEHMQTLAAERGRSKRSLRPEVVVVAGYAGFGVLGSQSDTEWAERATDWRETGTRPEQEEFVVAERNRLAQEAPEGGRTSKIRALLKERKEQLIEAKEQNKQARWAAMPNHGNETAFAANWHTLEELAELIFRPSEWMMAAEWPQQESEPPSDEEAHDMRIAQESESDDDDGDNRPQEQRAASGRKRQRKEESAWGEGDTRKDARRKRGGAKHKK